MTNIIQCENIVKRYKDFSLKNISFTIKPGYLTGLIGVNGAGKTTLINIIAGLDTDFHGRVNINGIDIKNNTAEAKQEIGLISEKLSFFVDKTAYENALLLGEYFNNWNMEDYYLWLDKMNIPKGKPIISIF